MDSKVGWPVEALAQDLIKNCTNIPVPPIQCILNMDIDESFIVMDFIPGITLVAAWPTMGLWQKLSTYASSTPSCIPDPKFLGPFSMVNSQQNVMHPTTSALFFNKAMDHTTLTEGDLHWGPLPDDGTLVYSHIDLALQNLILGEDSQLWLIDFTMAGFYPTWFEYMNMVIDAKSEGGPEYDSIWWAIIPFIADPYFCTYKWISMVVPQYLGMA
ncbi:hypothetical protein EDD18DRAFT_1109255 [Armillaria luteobubalina]|uniref:Aminoglycoside phosphotransferase domain-containing protein n=1 Tax=Armillaria luteobubalina TaxID=153913 RepID=A0AA39PXY8_9AGAR|nr:hypothetical protein EDD18DRAFT_1109255 [Armillaria luteobubalina]